MSGGHYTAFVQSSGEDLSFHSGSLSSPQQQHQQPQLHLQQLPQPLHRNQVELLSKLTAHEWSEVETGFLFKDAGLIDAYKHMSGLSSSSSAVSGNSSNCIEYENDETIGNNNSSSVSAPEMDAAGAPINLNNNNNSNNSNNSNSANNSSANMNNINSSNHYNNNGQYSSNSNGIPGSGLSNQLDYATLHRWFLCDDDCIEEVPPDQIQSSIVTGWLCFDENYFCLNFSHIFTFIFFTIY